MTLRFCVIVDSIAMRESLHSDIPIPRFLQITIASAMDVDEMLSQDLSHIRINVTATDDSTNNKTAVGDLPGAEAMEVCEDANQTKGSNPATDKGKATMEKGLDAASCEEAATVHIWRFGDVADFINKLAMQLTLADVDSVCFLEAIQLLDQSTGHLDDDGTSAVKDCLRHASEINPRVKKKLQEAAADKPENLFLPIDIPQHVRALIRSAVGESTNDTIPVHAGVECDGCGMSPIQGRRYKSLNRPDFDICFECHSKTGEEWSKDPYISFYTPFPDMQRAFMGHFMNMMPQHGFGGPSGCRMRRGWCHSPAAASGCPRQSDHAAPSSNAEAGEPCNLPSAAPAANKPGTSDQ